MHIAKVKTEWPHHFAILALDNGRDPLVQQKFKAVMNSLSERYQPLLGRWQGVTEPSWLVPSAALEALGDAGLICDQESILFVSECNKMYSTLLWTANGNTEPMGNLCEVSEDEAWRNGEWTMNCSTGVYYMCKHNTNPDSIPPEAGWPSLDRVKQIKNYQAALTAVRYEPSSALTLAHLEHLRCFLTDYFGVSA